MSKLCLFDIDGTLTQTMGLTDAAFRLDDYADLKKFLETLEAVL